MLLLLLNPSEQLGLLVVAVRPAPGKSSLKEQKLIEKALSPL